MRFEWVKAFFMRRFAVVMLLLMNIAFIVYTLYSTSFMTNVIGFVMTLISYAVVISVVSGSKKTDYKLIWSIMILSFPVFGGLFYLLLKIQSSTKRYEKLDEYIEERCKNLCDKRCQLSESERKELGEHGNFLYLEGLGFPVCRDNAAEYYACGEDMLVSMERELQTAEKYIFLEYFIIENGVFWGKILNILKKKASEGVTVRVLFDDVGCFMRLPAGYENKLASLGIECRAFNRVMPFVTSVQNNRDHRKMMVIDGRAVFTGGVNLSDEYINVKSKLGKWKDCGILIKGDAARSFTLMFLKMWDVSKGSKAIKKSYADGTLGAYKEFFKDEHRGAQGSMLVQPYSDVPLDSENVSENVYMNVINGARRYLYIFTPYLIIDENVISALKLASKRGVDVRIITPHKGDKRFVHVTTRSYYAELISAGVKIYEYMPGFIHSKMFVSDDNITTVGTVNLDYRSLYLHFECGSVIYGKEMALCAKNDFVKTIEESCEITADMCKENRFKGRLRNFYRLFAPLM